MRLRRILQVDELVRLDSVLLMIQNGALIVNLVIGGKPFRDLDRNEILIPVHAIKMSCNWRETHLGTWIETKF